MAGWAARHAASSSPGTARAAARNRCWCAAEAQLIVVGSRGLGSVEGMSLGSVAGALVRHSPCPVGVAHPAAR
jgi:nucleotide-binding universal stress UspA family protein